MIYLIKNNDTSGSETSEICVVYHLPSSVFRFFIGLMNGYIHHCYLCFLFTLGKIVSESVYI